MTTININYHADIAYAKIIAEKSDLRLEIRDGCTPCTDGKKIILPKLDPLWGKGSPEYNDWWYSLIHECFHNLHPEDFVLLKEKEIQSNSFLGTVMNLACDFKIEDTNRGIYRGRDKIVKEARYLFAKEKIYEAMNARPAADIKAGILHAVWVMDAYCRSSWIPEYTEDDLESKLSPIAKDCLKQLLDHKTICSDYASQVTADDTYQVAVDIINLFGLDEEEEKGKPEPQEGEGESGEGDGEGGDEGEWQEFGKMLDDHSEERGTIPCAVEVNKNAGDWMPIHVSDYKFKGEKATEYYAWDDKEFNKLISGSSLSKTVRKELQYLARTKKQTGFKTGRIHAKSLTKVKTGGSARVFSKKSEKISTKETTVSIFMDCSGSMEGRKYMTACASAYLLSDVLTKLRITHNILGFTSSIGKGSCGSDGLILPFKTFGEGFDAHELTKRFEEGTNQMAENSDGDLLLSAAQTLVNAKGKRKILIVLSDGSPSACDTRGERDGCYPFAKDVIQSLDKSPALELYGVGILDRSVQEFYSNYVVVNEIDELESSLLTVLKNKFVG